MKNELKLKDIKLNTIIRQSEKGYTCSDYRGNKRRQKTQSREEVLELKIDKLNIDFKIKKLVYGNANVINNNENDNLDFKTFLQNYTEENKYMKISEFKRNLKELIFNYFTTECLINQSDIKVNTLKNRCNWREEVLELKVDKLNIHFIITKFVDYATEVKNKSNFDNEELFNLVNDYTKKNRCIYI